MNKPFDDALTIGEAAEWLDMEPEAVTDLCVRGYIDSWLDYDTRYLFEEDLKRYFENGPNTLMSFGEAIKLVLTLTNPEMDYRRNRVRRPCWNKMDYLGHDPTYRDYPRENDIADVAKYGYDGWFEPYNPSNDDRTATDFYLHHNQS